MRDYCKGMDAMMDMVQKFLVYVKFSDGTLDDLIKVMARYNDVFPSGSFEQFHAMKKLEREFRKSQLSGSVS